MSEWSIEHAWKSTPPARADAHKIPPTHSRSTTSRNNDVRRRVPVNHCVARGFGGYVTQFCHRAENWLDDRSRTRPPASQNGVFKSVEDGPVVAVSRQPFGWAAKKFQMTSLTNVPVDASRSGLKGICPGTFSGVPYQACRPPIIR